MNSDFNELLRALNDVGAEYLVVGGYAVGKHTEPRYTKDLDVWVNNSEKNAVRVLEALKAYGAPISDLSLDDLTADDMFYQIGVEPLRIDIIAALAEMDFNECWRRRVVAEVDNISVNFISIPDLITNKEMTGRPMDLVDAKNLRKKLELDGTALNPNH